MMNRRRVGIAFLAVVAFACESGTADQNANGTQSRSEQPESRLATVKRTGRLRVGYGGFPPYLVETQPGQVSGFAVEMIGEIVRAADTSIRIEWVPTKWDRVILDFQSGKFDLVVEPLIQTLPRAMQVGFSVPYTYIGYGVAVVRTTERRFATLADIDKPGVTAAVTSTASSHHYALRVLKSATIRALPAGSLDQPFLEVLSGRADVAFADEVTVRNYLRQHGTTVKALFLDHPPERVGAGFLLPQGDFAWNSFLNSAIAYMQTTGAMRKLAMKYELPYFETTVTRVTPVP